MSKFKVGDRVKFTGAAKGIGTNREAEGWLNKTMTISRVRPDTTFGAIYNTEEDSHHFYREVELALAYTINKIIITQSGMTTLARLYEGDKVIKSATAKCAPGDTYDFELGACIAVGRLYDRKVSLDGIPVTTKCGEPMKVEAVGDKPKYKVGDKVKVVGNGCWHKYKNGDILTLAKSENNDCHAYENATTWRVQEGDSYIAEQDIEPYTEPAPEPKREPVVLYCVKSWSGLCQKDKVYAASADGHLIFDNGQRSCFEVNHERFKHEWKDQLIECVKRPAKVGEWVLVTNASTYIENKYKNGDIVQVKVGKDGAVRFGDCGTWSSMGLSEYLVLDGYQPEPEKCKCCGQIITGEAQS